MLSLGVSIPRLSVHEQHAQAAAIIGMAERLEDLASREYIAAKFGGMTKPEHVTVMMNRIFQTLGTGFTGAAAHTNCCCAISARTLATARFGTI
ncbi:hypothetical protein C8R32_1126 [Nitrosospira sp. Nsp5]|nr:hypothetical protein C8R32_1126 [Nitrosospira sp. Nsp5]